MTMEEDMMREPKVDDKGNFDYNHIDLEALKRTG